MEYKRSNELYGEFKVKSKESASKIKNGALKEEFCHRSIIQQDMIYEELSTNKIITKIDTGIAVIM